MMAGHQGQLCLKVTLKQMLTFVDASVPSRSRITSSAAAPSLMPRDTSIACREGNNDELGNQGDFVRHAYMFAYMFTCGHTRTCKHLQDFVDEIAHEQLLQHLGCALRPQPQGLQLSVIANDALHVPVDLAENIVGLDKRVPVVLDVFIRSSSSSLDRRCRRCVSLKQSVMELVHVPSS